MAFEKSSLPKGAVVAVRRLDVAWAHRFLADETGSPFQTARSEVSGESFTADEVALIALHQLRITLGSKSEAKASREWLRARRLRGLFGQPLDAN